MSRDPRLANRKTYRYWTRDTVRFSDTDMAGHVNNVAICAWLETGRLGFLRELGLIDQPGTLRCISAGLNVSFLRESHWPGEVAVGCGVLGIGTSSFVVAGGVFRDDACIAAAEMPIVQLDGHRPDRLDEALRSRLLDYSIVES